MKLRLGKAPAKRDPRTLQLRSILRRRKLPRIPQSYDFDQVHGPIPTPMFANDQFGDCVIAGRAHATLRFEKIEQQKLITISDKEVLWEWRNEQGGGEDGLVLLDSLKCWRKYGWTAGGKHYKCAAFAAINPCDTGDVMASVYLFGSLQAGFGLPYSVTRNMSQLDIWTITEGPECAADPDGGHLITLVGYDQDGPIGITWGRRQRMSWAFLEAYCDELYAVVDALDAWRTERPGINVHVLEDYLRQIAA